MTAFSTWPRSAGLVQSAIMCWEVSEKKTAVFPFVCKGRVKEQPTTPLGSRSLGLFGEGCEQVPPWPATLPLQVYERLYHAPLHSASWALLT